jgi:hypothetical protein
MQSICYLDKKLWKEYLRSLREGLMTEPKAVEMLVSLACETHDQQVQKAALTGLAKHGTSEALLGIARRLLDNWGMGAIGHSIRMCGRLVEEGGLVLLAATLFYDYRFIHEKLQLIKKVLATRGEELTIRQRDELGEDADLMREPKLVNKWREQLRRVANLDIREGVVFGSQFEGTVGWIGRIPPTPKPDPQELLRARQYVQSRIPNLERVFEDGLRRMS